MVPPPGGRRSQPRARESTPPRIAGIEPGHAGLGVQREQGPHRARLGLDSGRDDLGRVGRIEAVEAEGRLPTGRRGGQDEAIGWVHGHRDRRRGGAQALSRGAPRRSGPRPVRSAKRRPRPRGCPRRRAGRRSGADRRLRRWAWRRATEYTTTVPSSASRRLAAEVRHTATAPPSTSVTRTVPMIPTSTFAPFDRGQLTERLGQRVGVDQRGAAPHHLIGQAVELGLRRPPGSIDRDRADPKPWPGRQPDDADHEEQGHAGGRDAGPVDPSSMATRLGDR